VLGAARVVQLAQPAHEVENVRVAPQPGRKAPKITERVDCIGVLADPAHVAVHAVRVGPVGLHRDRGKPELQDQALRELGTLAVKLVRAVGRLADQNQARTFRQVEQRIEVGAGPGKRVGAPFDDRDELLIAHERQVACGCCTAARTSAGSGNTGGSS
jgi:hypothetical protein